MSRTRIDLEARYGMKSRERKNATRDERGCSIHFIYKGICRGIRDMARNVGHKFTWGK